MIGLLAWGLSAAMALVLLKSRYNYQALEELKPEVKPERAQEPVNVTVVIPARNEAHQIARVVKSFPRVRVLVVDDDSSDGTRAAAEEAGAEVMAAPVLPRGAKGKPNACAAGAAVASSKWLLFVDADTWFETSFAALLVGYAERNGLALVTAFLRQHTESLAEHALLPYAFALYFTGVSARNVNSARSGECLANGQCLLFERSAYERIGGHGSVVGSVIEDVAIAGRAKQAGLAVRVIRAERLGHVRMYEGLRSIWRGFEKNSFRFLLLNPWSGMQVVLASIVMTSWLPVVVMGMGDLRHGPGGLKRLLEGPAGVLLVLPFVLLWPWYGRRVALAPVGIYLFQAIALNGMAATMSGRKSVWKDRHV